MLGLALHATWIRVRHYHGAGELAVITKEMNEAMCPGPSASLIVMVLGVGDTDPGQTGSRFHSTIGEPTQHPG